MGGRLSSPVLVGRASELRTLEDALAEARRGIGRVVLVGGEAGIGKTRLIDRAASEARAAGMLVVRGDCLDLAATTLPFAPFAEIAQTLLDRRQATSDSVAGGAALRSLTSSSNPWPEVGPGASGDVGQARLFTGVRDALRAVSTEAPLVVIVEDVQWAEASTIDLLRFVAHGLSSDAVAIVASYRTDYRRARIHGSSFRTSSAYQGPRTCDSRP